jgi:hypothetical protein
MDFVGATKSFVEILMSIVSQKDKRDAKFDEALKAVTIAVNKTRSYLRYLKDNEHDSAKEEILAELWTDASVKLRKIDNNLAFDCHKKAYYWSNPEAEIRPTVRRLDDIHNDCLRLLMPIKDKLSQSEIISLGLFPPSGDLMIDDVNR